MVWGLQAAAAASAAEVAGQLVELEALREELVSARAQASGEEQRVAEELKAAKVGVAAGPRRLGRPCLRGQRAGRVGGLLDSLAPMAVDA